MQTNPNNQPQPVQPTHGTPTTRPGKLLRLPRVMDLTGFGKSSIYSGVKAGTFPAPVRLSARAVGWRETDLDRWINERTTTTAAGK